MEIPKQKNSKIYSKFTVKTQGRHQSRCSDGVFFVNFELPAVITRLTCVSGLVSPKFGLVNMEQLNYDLKISIKIPGRVI